MVADHFVSSECVTCLCVACNNFCIELCDSPHLHY